MATPKVSGIYEIVNLVNGKRYIGSTSNFKRRWQDHVSYLKRGQHHSPQLQRAWFKYGQAAFEFVVIEYCATSILLDREQAHIDVMAPAYNVCQVAGSSRGISHTAKAKANMSAAQKAHWAQPEARAALLERVRKPENRAKSSAANRGNTYAKGKPRPQHVRKKISDALSGTKHHQTDWRVHTLRNSDGVVVSGIQIDIRTKTGITGPELSNLISGRRSIAKGWRVASSV